MTQINPVGYNLRSSSQRNVPMQDAQQDADSRVQRTGRSQLGKRSAKSPANGTKRQRCSSDLVQVHAIKRDDVFRIGEIARNQFVHELFEELGGDAFEKALQEPIEAEAEKSLSKKDYQDILSIEEKRSRRVGSQVFELFYLAETNMRAHPRAAKKIKSFALKLANSLPEKQEGIPEDAGEIEGRYKEMAQEFSARLGFELPDEEIQRLAYRLQEAKADEEDTSVQVIEEQQDRESDILRIFGNLILIAEKDIVKAAACLYEKEIDDCFGNILNAAKERMKEAKARILIHERDHERTALQNIDQAVFSKMSLEMAKLIVLDSGGFNLGILGDLAEHLIPEPLADTAAVENLLHTLAQLEQNAQLWYLLSRAEKPKTKDLPSNDLVRAVLGLSPKDEITDRDAKIVILSSVFDHLRQARAGTCFATCWMIQTMMENLNNVIQDFIDCIRTGYMKRIMHSETKKFPFHTQLPRGELDTEVTVNPEGKLLAVRKYGDNAEQEAERPNLNRHSYLHEAPGMIAACRAVGFEDPEQVLSEAIQNLGNTRFYLKDILSEIAKIAYFKNQSFRYGLRSVERHSFEELASKAEYAFNAQTNPPMHRAWEEILTSMVDYFNSQYFWPHWTFRSLEETLNGAWKKETPDFKRKTHQLLDQMFLPMITRMRYRYNHDMDDEAQVFEDDAGTRDFSNFGYELCDAGLPDDFEYSTDLRKEFKQETMHFTIHRFQDHAPPQSWKAVDSAEKFQDFLCDLVQQTTEYLKTKEPAQANVWNEVEKKWIKKIRSETFIRSVVENQFGRGSDQKKELLKNENAIATTPWKFRWGGDYTEVLNTYHSFKDHPVKSYTYSGTPKEVLAWQINYMKKQEGEIQEEWKNPFAQTIMTAPGHAFLFKPGEPTFQHAWTSEMDTNEYIRTYIEEPGNAVAQMPIPRTAQRQLIDFIANNSWVRACDEKHHLERQELTETSKRLFDQSLAAIPNLYQMKLGEFRNALAEAVIQSRFRDLKIGKRNRPWEGIFKRRLDNKIKSLMPGQAKTSRVPRAIVHELIDFARNRKDRLALSPQGAQQFRLEAEQLQSGLSQTEFRNALLKLAQGIHQEEIASGVSDKNWLEKVAPQLDNKLFKLLSPGAVHQLMQSAICTADTNWAEGIHSIYFIFMVNPGSGELELCRWTPDTEKIEFMEQSHWFPKKQGHYWQLPRNYYVYEHEPTINLQKFVEV